MSESLIEDIYEVFGEDAKLQSLKILSPGIAGGMEFQMINGDNIDIYDIDEDKINKILDFVSDENEFFTEKVESKNEFFTEKDESKIIQEVENYIKTL